MKIMFIFFFTFLIVVLIVILILLINSEIVEHIYYANQEFLKNYNNKYKNVKVDIKKQLTSDDIITCKRNDIC